MIDPLINILIVSLLGLVALVRLPALWKPAQRPVWLAAVTLLAGQSLIIKPVTRLLTDLAGGFKLAPVVSGFLGVAFTYFLANLALHLYVGDGERYRRLRLWWGGYTVLTLSITVTTTVLALTGKVKTRERFLPALGTFTVVNVYWIAYLLYMIALTTLCTVIFWRLAIRTRSFMPRLAMATLAVATSICLAYLGSRVLAYFSAEPTLITFGFYSSATYFILIAVGCSLTALEPLRHSIADWLQLQSLYGLWRELVGAVPHVALEQVGGRGRDMLRFTRNRWRLQRRIIEIRDAMLVLREWISAAELDRIRSAVREANLTGERAQAATTACWLELARRAKLAGAPRVPEPLDLVRQGGADLAGEVSWLSAVRRARRLAVVRAVEGHSSLANDEFRGVQQS
ncbi:hypothetical protein D5S17_13795 [Pseudonocardiaceae bacterium YIM PH 21723]|nr:hypothetical protein D5S17_13795 [Pseudonocardiaceae bacterium YIM PH 21723]